MSDAITVHIEGVPPAAITDALIAIELCDERGLYDDEQHARLGPLVVGLRVARETAA